MSKTNSLAAASIAPAISTHAAQASRSMKNGVSIASTVQPTAPLRAGLSIKRVSFTVLGVPLSTDAAAVQLGFDLAVAPDVILNAGYDGSFSSKVQNNAIRAGLSLAL